MYAPLKRISSAGKRMTELLRQNVYQPMPFEKQVAILYAGVNGYLDDIDVENIQEFESTFLEYVGTRHEKFFESLREGKELTEQLENELKKAIEDFKKTFNKP